MAIFTLAGKTIAKPGNCMRIMDWYVFNMLNLINGYFHLYYPNYFIVSNRHLAGAPWDRIDIDDHGFNFNCSYMAKLILDYVSI